MGLSVLFYFPCLLKKDLEDLFNGRFYLRKNKYLFSNLFPLIKYGDKEWVNMEKQLMNFTAIDFETATGKKYSACAVGIITVEKGKIIDEYNSLIQPPDNEYLYYNTNVHGITENDTVYTPFFPDVFPEIRKRLQGKTIVAHNESFDRSVLQKTMEYYDLDYSELNISNPWECTLKIYRAKGYIQEYYRIKWVRCRKI